jgi:GH25 family lysozyme M1 (1,4-beta-N-acetylmuramidase)
MAKKIKFPFVLDVSSWKGTINWNGLHPRPDLVICEASNGAHEWDDLFSIHWSSLKRSQIKRGAYHVFDPKTDGFQQIKNYWDSVEHAGGFDENCIAPILDASNFHYSHRNGDYPNWANKYLLWIPWYPSEPEIYKCPPKNTFPCNWDDWTMWKYDELGKISGINGFDSLSTLSESYASQIGLTGENRRTNSQHNRQKFEATIVATEGVIIRKQSLRNSKMLAFLMNGTGIVGEAIEIVNAHEAWLKVTKPVIGWCPIVDTGKIYISISCSA